MIVYLWTTGSFIYSLYFHKSVEKFRINRLQVCDYQASTQNLLVKDHTETGVYEVTMKESLQKERRI